MSYPPPPPGGYGQNQSGGYGQNQSGGYRLPEAPQRPVTGLTLGQFWRSDTRVVPGRKPAKWAGRAAFWLGLIALALYLFDLVFVGTPSLGVAIATPVGVVAFLFGLIAVIAGVARGLGILGLILAVASSIWFWTWVQVTFS